ncbi:amidohydrolase [Caldimonas thermodepolymerans]|jgi:amidohydrolase|uniref:Amidohydrolase n=1 Tax=Caldimonas thermodepolymerans TaxID=215580 RepID=A0A2S5T616_9BURK|nr:M20 aminoacylase family protein [Caldimonas thermodepolymerans]PPE70440.1 amidohydrolase [Caldimonas thermodepolymerans]QPC31107.1 amidohydrolase [Caldimonas thermodepolymerans]RDH96557.1 hippurate hydrolase [Caldimonas thermodepolymerans]TCP04844.1 hippurate hydrolase [Caldimonas thermodepolymerans]UZG43831.1 M20 family metallopeptidase [Caldimonas thermodepolymerans]
MLRPVTSGVFSRIAAYHPELTAFRRDLHAHPELGFEEVRTASRVVEALKLTGVDEIHTGIARTGVVAVIHGRSRTSGRSIGLRADMDALPMREENDFAWRSGKPGLMHGCGHDGHTTMLVGAARYLAETRRFDGTVYLIFQPGEEGCAGAKAMIDDGLFERFPAQAVYAMHNWPHLPAGQIGVAPGPMMAAADRIEITVTGKGGHGAHPHLAVDPVLVCGHIITAAQSLVSRNVSPFDNAVVSLCAMQAGDVGAMSVIPRQAKLVGTVRTFRPQLQDMIEERLGRLVESIAVGFGASATLDYQRIYPATINSREEAEFAADVAESLVGPERVVRDLPPSMGAEDFSFMLQVKPGAYLRIGQGRDATDPGCFLHSSRYDFNDEILPLGSALFASLAERAMPLP